MYENIKKLNVKPNRTMVIATEFSRKHLNRINSSSVAINRSVQRTGKFVL